MMVLNDGLSVSWLLLIIKYISLLFNSFNIKLMCPKLLSFRPVFLDKEGRNISGNIVKGIDTY